MTNQNLIVTPLSRAEVEGMIARGRTMRTEAMRQALSALGHWVTRLAVGLRPDRERLPQAGAWALRPRPSACSSGNFA
jgi:hypothetical protein